MPTTGPAPQDGVPHSRDDRTDHAVRDRLSATLDAIHDLVFEVDLDGRFLDSLTRRTELLARPSGEYLGKLLTEVLPPAAAAVWMDAIHETQTCGRSHGRQFELDHETGRRWFELSTSTLHVAPSAPPRCIVLAHDITARKQDEEALRRREAMVRCILGATADGILAVDRVGKVLQTNRRFAELWRIPQALLDANDDDALLGCVVSQLADPDGFVKKVRSLYDSDQELTDTVVFKDGRMFERFTSPLLLDGVNIGRVWSFRDITARRQSEAALVDSRNLLQTIIDTAPMRVFWKDRDLRYLGCNPAFAADAGRRDPGELVGLDDFQMGWADQAEAYRADDRAVMESGVAKLGYEEPQTTPNGQEIWLRTSKVPLQRHDGETIGVLGIYEDVTERHRIERRLAMAIEVTRVVMWELDLVSNRLTYDHHMLPMLGLGTDMAPDTLPGWLECVHPEDRPAMTLHLQEVLEGDGQLFDLEYRMAGKEASWQWIHTKGRVCGHDSSGRPVLAVGTSMNVTARREAAAALVAAREAADAANRAKSEFLANMSHELRTPLNGVLGNIQLLEMSSPSPEQLTYLTAISAAGNSLLSLINDVLDLSKLEADRVTLEQVVFSLRHCLSGLVRMQQVRAEDKGLDLRVEVADPVPDALVGDELRLKQILGNLLSNAIKFTDTGSVTIAAAVQSITADTVQLELAVRDTGIGIAPEFTSQLFAPFVQADTSITRRFGGTGLGLSICRRLAGLMGGSIAVDSREGAGSTFRVSLPFGLSATAAEVVDRTTSAPIDRWTGPALKVLLAEDNEINRRFGIALLAKLGHQVVAVGDGQEALVALAREPFDLVLMDLQMPVLDGLAALGRLRALEAGTAQHVPVIAVTANAAIEDERRCRAAGFDGYVRKPLAVSQLIAEMQQVLRAVRRAP